MRVAELCPNCATYINASCIIYDGEYLPAIGLAPLTSLDEALEGINNTFSSLSGAGAPTSIPLFVGQFYIDTNSNDLYIGLSTSSANWGLIADIITTTTSTTA